MHKGAMFYRRFLKLFKNNLLSLQGLKLSRRRRIKNNRQAPIKLWWWKYKNGKSGQENFGDVVTTDIIKSIFGYNVVFSEIYQCQMIGIGSIIYALDDYADTNIVNVWGSGYIDNERNLSLRNSFRFWCVRGQFSQKRINKENYSKDSLTLGDPGILVSLVYQYKKNNKAEKIGFIPHYCNIKDKLTNKIRKDKRFVVISPLDRPENIAKKIVNCKLVLSSSLHGLIFSDSFKVPNFCVPIIKKSDGGDYKFKDYYSGVDKKYCPVDIDKIFDQDYLDELIKSYEPIKKLKDKQRKIIKSFPYY